MDELKILKEIMDSIDDVPTLDKMPRRALSDKGINGPTSAHVIEEVHTPFNYEYITFTTGTSAFQNIVGVLKYEIPERVKASHKALSLSNVKKGDRLLVTYPPLVNVFSKEALESYGLKWKFLEKSSRDAVIYSICRDGIDVVIGESSFLRATIEDAKKSGLIKYFPKKLTFITAGTALDTEILESIKGVGDYQVHDLYGTQEFGWICLDGIPLRDDISLIKSGTKNAFDLIVGGVPTGDRFIVDSSGHLCNRAGKIITYSKERVAKEYECIILETILSSRTTVERVAKTVLRSKSKVVRVDQDIKLSSEKNIVGLKYYDEDEIHVIDDKTKFLDDIIMGQLDYQSHGKKDPVWTKRS
jgi:hypothetical protein